MKSCQISSSNVRRLVGLADVILTIALIVQICCFTIYPFIKETQEIKIMELSSFHGVNCHHLAADHHKKAEFFSNEHSVLWIKIFLGFCAIGVAIPILASILLIMSTFSAKGSIETVMEKSNNNIESNLERECKALRMTRLWMTCNKFAILVFTVVFIVVWLIHRYDDSQIWVPYPTLFYLVFRAILTVIIWKHLELMNENLIQTYYADVINANTDALPIVRSYEEKLPIPHGNLDQAENLEKKNSQVSTEKK